MSTATNIDPTITTSNAVITSSDDDTTNGKGKVVNLTSLLVSSTKLQNDLLSLDCFGEVAKSYTNKLDAKCQQTTRTYIDKLVERIKERPDLTKGVTEEELKEGRANLSVKTDENTRRNSSHLHEYLKEKQMFVVPPNLQSLTDERPQLRHDNSPTEAEVNLDIKTAQQDIQRKQATIVTLRKQLEGMKALIAEAKTNRGLVMDKHAEVVDVLENKRKLEEVIRSLRDGAVSDVEDKDEALTKKRKPDWTQ